LTERSHSSIQVSIAFNCTRYKSVRILIKHPDDDLHKLLFDYIPIDTGQIPVCTSHHRTSPA